MESQSVPAELRHLIPVAQQWGIGDDVARLAVAPHQERITQWLNSFGQGLMSDEAANFMYMQVAIEEMTYLP